MTTTASHVSRCFLFAQPLAALLDAGHQRISCQAPASKMCSPTPERLHTIHDVTGAEIAPSLRRAKGLGASCHE